jgi:hypothetical protein
VTKPTRSVLERIFEAAGVTAGLAIVGSCSYAGYAGEGVGTGVLAGVLGFAVAAVIVSVVFIVTRTSADVRAIRERVERLQDSERGGGKEDRS